MKTIRQSLRALKEEDHRRALYAALVFIMLLILFFLLVSLEVPDPPKEEKVVELVMDDIIEYDFGSQAEGASQSKDMNPNPAPVPENMVEPSVDHDVQDESSVQVVESNGPSDKSSSSEQVSPPVDNTFTFGNGNGNGIGNGSGDQFGNGSGVGGNGNGSRPGDGTYNPNRKLVQPPNFNANAQEEGRIGLDIYVDARGNVVKTKFKQSKSTSGSDYLKKLAERAARTMKYNKKPGAGMEYVGYQIFTFKKS